MIHGVEIYLTEQLEEKIRDNYHTILLAKNIKGVLELNRLVSRSCDKDHFYYVNRITFDEFLSISDNIISTSACLASPLNKLSEDHSKYEALIHKYDFLEVQPHLHPDQIEYNRKLEKLSIKYNKPLIAGTDTHSSSKYKSECRDVLLVAKHKSYGDEDAFDLTFKTYDELVNLFYRQNALTEDAYLSALDNTNRLYEMTEGFELDTSIKYPLLYDTREFYAEKLSEIVWEKLNDKLSSGIIPPEQEEPFHKAIEEELRVFNKLGVSGFMLSTSELVSWCREQGMAICTARGSVGGSRVAYVTDIIDLNPETWSTVFSRFCNEDRVEIGDIDIDCVEDDRPKIFEHIINRFGEDKTARVAAFGTIQAKKAIEDIGRCLEIRWKANHEDNSKNPYALPKIDAIKKEFTVLKTVQVIRDACSAIGVPYPKTYEIDWDDEAVWKDITKNPSSIFQFESSFAADCLKKYNAKSIYDMSLVTACIRPSGASYRNELLTHKKNKNPSEIIDDLLKDNHGYLIYQEDTIKFLQQICGLTGSEADNVRRAIGRKDIDRLNKALPQILEGYCTKSSKPRNEAEQEAKAFLQIIEDSAYYQFGYNHSIAYCLLGYL